MGVAVIDSIVGMAREEAGDEETKDLPVKDEKENS